jgi:hypothetical protein
MYPYNYNPYPQAAYQHPAYSQPAFQRPPPPPYGLHNQMASVGNALGYGMQNQFMAAPPQQHPMMLQPMPPPQQFGGYPAFHYSAPPQQFFPDPYAGCSRGRRLQKRCHTEEAWCMGQPRQHGSKGNMLLGSAFGLLTGGSIATACMLPFALPMLMMSDERSKRNIVRSRFEVIPGVPFASWEYKSIPGKRFTGVIAQDLLRVAPQFVHQGDDGFLRVDYSFMMGA